MVARVADLIMSEALSTTALLTLTPTFLPSLSLSQDYGGYLSTYILPAKGENQGQIFTCGSALSPITDFKLYGKVLTRRVGPQQGPTALPFGTAFHPPPSPQAPTVEDKLPQCCVANG